MTLFTWVLCGLLAGQEGLPRMVCQCRPERTSLALSETVTVELSLEVRGLLRVVVPKNWLDEPSEATWQATPIAAPQVQDLPDGRKRWIQRLKLDPFLVGDAVALQFRPVQVWTESEAQPREQSWPALSLRVTTIVKPTLDQMRPVADYDDGPKATDNTSGFRDFLIGVTVLTLLALAGWWLARYRSRRARVQVWMAQDRLLQLEKVIPELLARELPMLLRHEVSCQWPIAGEAASTMEWLQALEAIPEAAKIAEQLRPILERCDAAKFAGVELLPAECAELLGQARELVQVLTSRNRVSQP